MGYRIVSTGGTANHLTGADIKVTDVTALTGFPEIMDGRVKTLHPKIHGGLLAKKDDPEHIRQMRLNDIDPIDILAVNLYPFEQAVAKPNIDLTDAIEQIDIGGPAMIRAAAKNYRHTTVVSDPDDYADILEELASTGEISIKTREMLALKVFSLTAKYNAAIEGYLADKFNGESTIHVKGLHGKKLRYGENPHQTAKVYSVIDDGGVSLTNAEILHGKEMSYNNYLDVDSAPQCELLAGHAQRLHRQAWQPVRHGYFINTCGSVRKRMEWRSRFGFRRGNRYECRG